MKQEEVKADGEEVRQKILKPKREEGSMLCKNKHEVEVEVEEEEVEEEDAWRWNISRSRGTKLCFQSRVSHKFLQQEWLRSKVTSKREKKSIISFL